MVQALQPLVEHGIYNNVRSNSMGGSGSVFRIADLGCATGINTLLVADTIVTAVKLTFIRHSVDVPEFQVFFADLPSNDFNTLFRTLPPLREDETSTGLTAPATHDQNKPSATRSYFASKSFEIESVRVLSGFPLHPLLEVREGEEEMFGRVVAKHYRALFENIVGSHLGWDEYLIDEFFSRIESRAAGKYGEYLTNTLDTVAAFLVRK